MSEQNDPFRSRPKVERQNMPEDSNYEEFSASEPEPAAPPAPPPIEDSADIIEGVIEEQIPQALVPAQPMRHEPIALPDDRPQAPRRQKRIARPGLLLIAIALFLGGTFVTVLKNADLPTIIEEWYPMLSLSVALLWIIVALSRRNVAAFIGGAVVAGLSMSLLLDAQKVATFQETVIGILLMTFGLSIIMRGLLLRPRRLA